MQTAPNAGVQETQEGIFSIYKDIWVNRREYSKNVFRKDYFKWLVGQMRNWSKFSWSIVTINALLQVYFLVSPFLAGPQTAKQIAVLVLGFFGANLSVLCVVGISNRASIQGWFGLTSVFFIATSAFISGAYATFVEQTIIYMLFLDIPSILHPSWSEKIVPRNFDGWKDWAKFITFGAVAWGVLYLLFSLTDDPMLVSDSLALALSVTGVLAMLNRYSNQYYFWLGSNVVSIVVFVQAYMMGTASPALAISYTLFVVNSLYGLVSWHKEANKLKLATKEP